MLLFSPTPTMPPTPKFRLTSRTLPTPKFYGPTLPTPPTPKFDPRHPRDLADSFMTLGLCAIGILFLTVQ